MNTDKDNNKLFITRKRKKWKFAHFDLWPNCIDLERGGSEAKARLQSIIDQSESFKDITLELAAGTAKVSLELAKKYTDRLYIAADIKSDRLYTAAKSALDSDINNLLLIRAQIRNLLDYLPERSIDTIWITFPDPQLKDRRHKHRLTGVHFLSIYSKLLKPDGQLLLKTDNRELFDWTLEQLKLSHWEIECLSRDLHNSSLDETYKIMTDYESKYVSGGSKIYFCKCRVPVNID